MCTSLKEKIRNRRVPMKVFASISVLFCMLTVSFSLVHAYRIRMVFFISDSDAISVIDVSKELFPKEIFVDFYCISDFSKKDFLDNLKNIIETAQFLFVDVMDSRIVDNLKPSIQDLELKEIPKIFALRESEHKDELRKLGFIFDEEIRKYFQWPSKGNLKNMILKVIHDHLDKSVSYSPPELIPEVGIYHPKAPKFFQSLSEYKRWYHAGNGNSNSQNWIGITFYGAYLAKAQSEMIDQLILRLEQEGFGVVPVFGPEEMVLKIFLEAQVDLVLSFTLKFSSALKAEIKTLIEQLDVPVLNVINLYSGTIQEWRASEVGVGPFELAYAVANPEVSGLVEPTVLAAKEVVKEGQKDLYFHRLIRENTEHLIRRIKKWLLLRDLPNSQKRIAILYYNHSPGKQDIGASYLNLFDSLREVFSHLKREGYDLGDKEVSSEELKELILAYGRNIGAWAGGELEELWGSGKAVLVPISEYLNWYEKLPQDFREKVEAQWGRPEDSKIMCKDGNFVIPAIRFGNVVIMPEPNRGLSDDPLQLYHSPSIYPHHQYIAAYLWLKEGFNAHAMVHFGTHATHEWLPGKQVGLSLSCPPEVLITDIPNIYPYIMDNIGEGTQAKRRGRGVIVDHLIPPLRKGGLYHEYARLYEKLQRVKESESMERPTLEAEMEGIKSELLSLGLKKEFNHEIKDPRDLDEIEEYLNDLRYTLIPFGLHTFGVSPSGEPLMELAEAIHQNFPQKDLSSIKERLLISGREEMASFLKGLKGRYVPSGEANDPVRNINAIPTGRNFYGFNPQKIPTKEAFEAGKRAAHELIQRSVKETGEFPKKVGIVLWAVETMRNGGLNESTVLALLGIEPVWDKVGRVTGLRPIPGSVLGRPRIDVLINPSGLYRDLFGEKLLFLDRAVRLARLQDDVENLIAQNSNLIKKRLMAKGYKEEEAEKLSDLRIFGEATGTYGTGISDLAGQSAVWEKDDELFHVYRMRVGNVFGEGLWGKEAKELFDLNLSLTDHVLHSFSSNLFAAMDNDDVFDYLGGLSLAVKKTSGRAPRASITFHRNTQETKVEGLQRVLDRELRARYTNPKWIQGMQREGYSGARQMAKFFEYLWGFQVTTPEVLSEEQWRMVFDVYVDDKYEMNLKEFFRKNSPWAYQSITARMLEAIRKEYWKADDKIKQRLALEYVGSVVESGFACCDHTCNNPFLNQMVLNLISVPGLVSPEIIANFQAQLRKTLSKDLEEQLRDTKNLKKKIETILAQNLKAPGELQARLEEVVGYKFEEVQEKNREHLQTSGIQWGLVAFVLGIISILALGFSSGYKGHLAAYHRAGI